MQHLVKEKGAIDIDKSYVDGGERPKQVVSGAGIIELAPGRPPRPIIHRRGRTFIYDDGLPVTNVEDVAHLPTRELERGNTINPREMAEAFIRGQHAGAPAAAPASNGVSKPGARGKAGRKGGVRLSAADDPRKLRPQAPPQPREVNLDRVLGGPKAGRRPARVTDPDDAE